MPLRIGGGKTSPQLRVQVGELTLRQPDGICDNGDVKATWNDDFGDPPRRVPPHFVESIQSGVVADDHRCVARAAYQAEPRGWLRADESPEIVGPVTLVGPAMAPDPALYAANASGQVPKRLWRSLSIFAAA